MTFVYPLLLGGLLLAGLPVLLHFLIRQKPKTLPFPAFRFLMQKRRSNTRNLRLRHLLLLLLRTALILLVCFALARPRLFQESLGLSREKPVALVLIFDTSPSMDYKDGEMTRLETAKKRCLDLLDQLPGDGRVLILDASDPSSFAREDWLKSLDKARQRVQGLAIRPTSVPVTKALDEAYRRLEKLDDPMIQDLPRLVCVFSDRTKASWETGRPSPTGRGVGGEGQSTNSVQTMYFDVGVDAPLDLAITHLELPAHRQSFTEVEKIPLRVTVKRTGAKIDNAILVKLGKKEIRLEFEADKDQQLTRTLEIDTDGLGPGLHQAEVKLETEKDALSFNNVRFVTFEIQKPQRVLVLADDVKKAEVFVRALQSLLYAAEVRPTIEPKQDFNNYEAIFLDGVAAPSDSLWTALTAFVQQGGGLGIILPGDELQKSAYNSEAAQKVMPGEVKSKKDAPMGTGWSVGPDDLDRPFLRRYQAWFTGDFDISNNPRHADHFWEVAPAEDKNVSRVVAYENGSPAILERLWPKSSGKVLLLTTPMEEQTTWNNYYSSLHSFYPGLTLLCARHLCKEPTEAKFNFQFGSEPPVVSKPQAFPKYFLTNGDFSEEIRFDENDRWVGDRLPRAGSYTLSGSNPGQETKVLYKFSVNIASEESDLTRVPIDEIEVVLGKDALVPHLDTLNWDEPMELFPWLMILVLFLLALENLLANRFYRQEPAPDPGK